MSISYLLKGVSNLTKGTFAPIVIYGCALVANGAIYVWYKIATQGIRFSIFTEDTEDTSIEKVLNR